MRIDFVCLFTLYLLCTFNYLFNLWLGFLFHLDFFCYFICCCLSVSIRSYARNEAKTKQKTNWKELAFNSLITLEATEEAHWEGAPPAADNRSWESGAARKHKLQRLAVVWFWTVSLPESALPHRWRWVMMITLTYRITVNNNLHKMYRWHNRMCNCSDTLSGTEKISWQAPIELKQLFTATKSDIDFSEARFF